MDLDKPQPEEAEVEKEEEVEVEIEVEVEEEEEAEKPENIEVEEEEEEEVEKEEEEVDQDQIPPVEVREEPLSKDLMRKVTQSRTRDQEVTENTEEETINTRVKIDKTVLVKPEERERKEVNTKRKERLVKSSMEKSSSSKKSKKSKRRSQKSSMRLLDNLLMISLHPTKETLEKRRNLEKLKVLKVSRPLLVQLLTLMPILLLK